MESLKNQTLDQKCKEEVVLINGNFNASEAKDILNNMVDKKINFHELRDFSQEIRFGVSDEHSKKRIKELKIAKESLNEFLKEAELTGKTLKIKSNIEIELI